MRVVPPVVAPMPSLSWPQHSSGLVLSGLLATSEPLTQPPASLNTQKGCKVYKHGWSKRDEGSGSYLYAAQQPLMAARDQCGGIEKLVDELCAKLKQFQEGETEAPQTPRPNFALVLQDMHNSCYSGYPSSLGGVNYSEGETWPDESCYYSDTWLLNNNNKQQHEEVEEKQMLNDTNIYVDDKHEEFLRVIAENTHNTITSLNKTTQDDDNDLDLYIDPSSSDDPSLARLIAKFDSTVEALWSPADSMINVEDKSPQVEQAFISSGTNLTSSIWSDTSLETSQKIDTEKPIVIGDRWSEETGQDENWDTTVLATNDEKSWQIGYGLGILQQQIIDNENETQQNSLNLINHHREKSGFTEVIRKTGKKENIENKISNAITIERTKEEDDDEEEEEEDLLTSTKTHFRPIKQNSLESTLSTSHDTVRYEDGTTFAISGSLDKPTYIRSASGCLYLNSLSSTPKKYMLYTEKEPFSGKYGITNNSFVPKFAVLRNEKSIQTDMKLALDNDESDIDDFTTTTGTSVTTSGFYFPEDEGHFADNIDCPADIEDEGDDDEEEEEDSESDNEQDNETGEAEFCIEQWKDIKTWSTVADDDDANNIPTWSDAKWCEQVASLHQLWHDGSPEACKPSDQLREELSAEGEQLFADIQYLQQLILGDCWHTTSHHDEEEVVVSSHSPDPWRHTERTYDDFSAASRTMHQRSTDNSLSIWEYVSPPPSCSRTGL